MFGYGYGLGWMVLVCIWCCVLGSRSWVPWMGWWVGVLVRRFALLVYVILDEFTCVWFWLDFGLYLRCLFGFWVCYLLGSWLGLLCAFLRDGLCWFKGVSLAFTLGWFLLIGFLLRINFVVLSDVWFGTWFCIYGVMKCAVYVDFWVRFLWFCWVAVSWVAGVSALRVDFLN